jgi:hypothetical protein
MNLMNLYRLHNLVAVAVAVGAISAGLCLTTPVEAQTPTYIGSTCTFIWDPNTESDLAGYRAWAVRGSTVLPPVTLTKTATSHPTSISCAELGVTEDGAYRFHVIAFDLAGNESIPATVEAVRDTVAPVSPGGVRVSSPQPVALSVTPNPAANTTTVAWVPGTCRREFIVSRLVSGRWVEVGRTQDTWLTVPLVNQVSQPYGVSAVCER